MTDIGQMLPYFPPAPEDDELDEGVATFDFEGRTYEIDDLGIGRPEQAGTYVLYCNRQAVFEFEFIGGGLDPYEVDEEDLIRAATAHLVKSGIAEAFSCDTIAVSSLADLGTEGAAVDR